MNPGAGAFADDISQCDGVGLAGSGVDCHVAVVNNIDLNDPTQNFSTVTTTTCIGDANAALIGSCATTVIPLSTTLTLNVDQCNGSTTSGSTLFCTVDVLNQVTGGSGVIDLATVNECIGSAAGGTLVSFTCDSWVDPTIAPPVANNAPLATATVVQCDGSANGGGALVDCSMDVGSSTSTAIPVKVNQCNGSANGGGSTVVCRTRIRTVFRTDITVPTYTTATTTPQAVPVLPSTHAVVGVVAPAPVVIPVVVTPPVTPPATVGSDTSSSSGTSGTSGSSGSSGSRDRLVNTGSLAQTGGTDPMPTGLIAGLLMLVGVGVVLGSRRSAVPRA